MQPIRFLVIFLLLLVTACASTISGISGRMIPSSQTNEVRLRHLDAVNTLRAEKGLSPVVYSAALNAAGETHARDMSVQRRSWHFGSDGTSPQDRAARAGYPGLIRGENISETYEHGVETLQGWLNDRDARRLILDPKATTLGLSWYQESDGKLWWVQMFGG